MKTIIILFISVFSTLSFSQNNDIFILIDNHSKLDTLSTQNDSLKLDIFRLKLNSNYLEYEFYKDSTGNLKKKIYSKTQKAKILELEYKNINNNNPQILISKNSHLNHITYYDIVNGNNFNKLINLIKSYNNIYLINRGDKCNSNYIAKKVIIKSNKSIL